MAARKTKDRRIHKILIANRGEIALRIIRTAMEMGLKTVAVYEKPDSEAYFIRLADEAILIGNGPRRDYLDVEKHIWAAKKSGADAIHPGYGFLAENPDFSAACEKAGIVFIGPSPEVIRDLGNKVVARKIMEKSKIPFIPGTGTLDPGEAGLKQAIEFGNKAGYPIMLKASLGGGGRGIRKVENESDLLMQLPNARTEAKSAFGDDSIYVEKCIEAPRHVEVQILADEHGNVIHLGTRDCSIQRRHQKLLEIAPADLPKDVLDRMYEAAIAAAKGSNYVNAGTVEFLVDSKTNEFWFMEVNTRLQVEHTVTEELTGVDIVRQQIRIAQGEVIDIPAERVHLMGKAVQVRINAEDPRTTSCPRAARPSRSTTPRADRASVSTARLPGLQDPHGIRLPHGEADLPRLRLERDHRSAQTGPAGFQHRGAEDDDSLLHGNLRRAGLQGGTVRHELYRDAPDIFGYPKQSGRWPSWLSSSPKSM